MLKYNRWTKLVYATIHLPQFSAFAIHIRFFSYPDAVGYSAVIINVANAGDGDNVQWYFMPRDLTLTYLIELADSVVVLERCWSLIQQLLIPPPLNCILEENDNLNLEPQQQFFETSRNVALVTLSYPSDITDAKWLQINAMLNFFNVFKIILYFRSPKTLPNTLFMRLVQIESEKKIHLKVFIKRFLDLWKMYEHSILCLSIYLNVLRFLMFGYNGIKTSFCATVCLNPTDAFKFVSELLQSWLNCNQICGQAMVYISLINPEQEKLNDLWILSWIERLKKQNYVKYYKTSPGLHHSTIFWLCCIRHDFSQLPQVAYVHKFYHGFRLIFDYYDRSVYEYWFRAPSNVCSTYLSRSSATGRSDKILANDGKKQLLRIKPTSVENYLPLMCINHNSCDQISRLSSADFRSFVQLWCNGNDEVFKVGKCYEYVLQFTKDINNVDSDSVIAFFNSLVYSLAEDTYLCYSCCSPMIFVAQQQNIANVSYNKCNTVGKNKRQLMLYVSLKHDAVATVFVGYYYSKRPNYLETFPKPLFSKFIFYDQCPTRIATTILL